MRQKLIDDSFAVALVDIDNYEDEITLVLKVK